MHGESSESFRKDLSPIINPYQTLPCFHDPITKAITTTPAGNLKILGDHCDKVYNHDDVLPEYEVVQDIDCHDCLTYLGEPL